MDDIQNIQLPDAAQNEDTRSESIDYEEDTSILDNSDTIPLKNGSPTISTNEKTDGEKLVQNTDNLLNFNLNSPKTTLLGKLKAKQRLQAFLLPKQNPFINSPIKKAEEISTKNDKNFRKIKQSPMEKAKSIIEELEEIKKVEIAQLVCPTLFKERKTSFREKQYRRKSRSRSVELTRKIIDKSKYPDNWEELKARQLTFEDVRDIKLSKASKNTKPHENCYDFRKQLLFETPSQCLNSLKVIGTNGQEKVVPSQSIRYTKNWPPISYSVNPIKYSNGCLSTEEVNGFLPKSHLDILKKFRTNKLEKFPEDSSNRMSQKWYPKQQLSNITEGCEILEKSLSLSILQNYMDEEEDEENKQEKVVASDVHETSVEMAVDVDDKAEELSLIEPETNFDISDTVTNEANDTAEMQVENTDVTEAKNDNEIVQDLDASKMKRAKNKKSGKIKHKSGKKGKRESRKRKRKKDKIDEKDNGNKKKKKGKNKGDKKTINSDQKKESKSKKKDVGKLDKKVDIDNKRKSSKESKKDKETNRDEKREEKVLDKIETKINDDREEIKRDSRRESRSEDHRKEATVFERMYDKKDDRKDDRKDSKKADKKEDKGIHKRGYKYYDQREDRKVAVKDSRKEYDKKEYEKKEPDTKEHDKKEHDKREYDKKEPDIKERDKEEYDKKEHDKKELDKREHGKKDYDKREHDKKDEKTRKIEKDKELTAKVQLYFDEFESISCRSLSKEKAVIVKKEDQARSRDASRETKTKEEPKRSSKNSSGREKKSKDTDIKETVEAPDTKNKKKDKFKDDNFKIEPLHPEEDLATPDTDEYHSHWESDADVSNVITYSPLIQGKINTSWESDEEEPVSSPDKVDHYVDQSSRRSSDRTDRRLKKFSEGERSLEMPLNILNVNRKDSRRIGKSPEFPDRKFLNNDMRLMYSEDSWERGEYLKICNDIEDEKLRYERKTLSEERRILEWEKRKIAEKLEKKSFDMFEDFNDGVVKEVTYERIYSGNEDVYLKSTEYIDEKKAKKRKKESDYDAKKKSDSASRKRKHSHDEDRKKRDITDDCKKYKSSSRKSRHDKLKNYDVKRESYKDDMIKIESEDEFCQTFDKKDETAVATKDNYKSSERLSSAAPADKTSAKHKTSRWSSSEKPEKPIDKIVSELPVDTLMMSDISDLNSTCDSLLTADVKAANKSDILENEYEEFLKAVTSDISNSGSVSKERKKPPLKKRKEVKKAKRKRRRKYSTSSSSSSSSSSDSDSSSSSSSSSSYSSSSSSSSTSSYDRKKKKRKLKLKAKAKTKAKQQQKEDKDKIVKIEMTHSIVKDLDDLQPFPISKMPTIEIKKEQEDPGYSTVPVVPPVTRELIPLPVPSPSIVPPPQLNLMSIKQEKPDHSVTSKADSTTSPVKKTPLIPTKFIAPTPRKDVPVSTSSNLSVGLDASKKNESEPAKTSPSVAVPSAKAVTNPVSFSMPFKPLVLNETVNDSNSQDFTENVVKKTANIEKKQVEEVKVDDMEKLELFVDSTKAEKQIVEEKTDQIPTMKVEVTVANTEPISPSSNLSDMKELEVVPPPSPYRKSTPIKEKIPSPVRRNPSPRKPSTSPRDWRRRSLSDISKRSPLRSVSPKYRHMSPRRDSITRRRSRDRSPLHRRDGRNSNRSSSKGLSPRRRTLFDKQDRRRKPHSPKREKNYSSRSRGSSISPKRRRSISPMNKAPMLRNRRSPSPRSRRSVSPGIRRSISPGKRRSVSPRGYRSPFRNHSPNSRSSPQSKNRRRSYSRSVSVERKKETIQQTLQRLAGMDERYHQPTNKSPINSPIEGFKRSVADSTISDDQLLQQNSIESSDSPAYRTPSARLVHSPSSPKRVPLDIRINQVLGLDKQTSKALTMNYAQQTTYTQSYTYDQYAEQYGPFAQHGPQQNVLQNKSAYVPPPPPPLPKPVHVATSKVVQMGNVLQVVPTEEIPTQETPKQAPSQKQKIVQVGNMLQIVPTPTSHVPKVEVIVPPPPIPIQAKAPVVVPQPSLPSQVQPPPPPIPVEKKSLATTIPEKVSAEELMLQKIAERRAERTKRHEERERKRNEKDKRRKEKEKKKQLKLKMRTESMIKKALRIETEALAMGESIDDNDESVMDTTPTCWPSMSLASTGQILKPAGKGILVAQGVSKINVVCDEQRKCVKFADGVVPGEGTSPSGGEELSSPPPPKEKQFKKIKKKKLHKKKKIKVKIIRKSSTDSPDDEELDNLPPPSPPPGSPPPHVFPARIKTHTINNIHPTYATGVPLMSVGNYAPPYRPNVPMSIPPPIHNLPHVSHHGPSGGRVPPQILSQHGPPMHGSMSHGVPSGLAHGMSSHSHGPIHHSSGPRL